MAIKQSFVAGFFLHFEVKIGGAPTRLGRRRGCTGKKSLGTAVLNYPSADGHQAYGYDVKCDVSSKGVDARLRPRPNVLHLLNYDLSFRLTCSALSVRCNWGTPPSFAHHVGRTWGSLIWSLIHPLHPLHPRHQAKAVGQQVTSLTVLPFLCAASKCTIGFSCQQGHNLSTHTKSY